MSASLVGSEMCIRDRNRIELSILRSRGVYARLGSGSTSALESSNKPAAVSYTHLTLPTICSV
eukprot:2835809-Alexandrium_andersonii.AAC.1